MDSLIRWEWMVKQAVGDDIGRGLQVVSTGDGVSSDVMGAKVWVCILRS